MQEDDVVRVLLQGAGTFQFGQGGQGVFLLAAYLGQQDDGDAQIHGQALDLLGDVPNTHEVSVAEALTGGEQLGVVHQEHFALPPVVLGAHLGGDGLQFPGKQETDGHFSPTGERPGHGLPVLRLDVLGLAQAVGVDAGSICHEARAHLGVGHFRRGHADLAAIGG